MSKSMRAINWSHCLRLEKSAGLTLPTHPEKFVDAKRVIYDCDADRPDELSFKEGEIIIVVNEKTEDDDWVEGYVEGHPGRHGVFPSSFVQII